MRTRARGAAAAVAVAVALSAATLSVAPAASASVGDLTKAVAADGAKVTAEKVIDARTVDLTISSPALGGPGTVRLILPKSWGTQPAWSFPTLYLLHGPDAQDYRSWTTYTQVESYAAGSDVLVAMPTGGPSAVYTNEFSTAKKPRPQWETFHTVELPQILQRGYRSNGRNAIAGVSSGGFGALSYAARHPDLYEAVGGFSAMTNLFDPAAALAVLNNRISAGLSVDPFGPLLTGIINKLKSNPQTQAAKYRGQRLFLSAGGGQPGPLDKTAGYTDQIGGRIIEAVVSVMSKQLASTAKFFGAQVQTDFYKDGLHYWTYWDRELDRSWSYLTTPLGAPTRTAPAATSGSGSGSGSSPVATTPAATPKATPKAKKSGLLGLFGGLFG